MPDSVPGPSGDSPSNWKVPDAVSKPSRKGIGGMSRRSKIVSAGVISTLVGGGLYGVSALSNNDKNQASSNDRRCVDNNNVVVNDSQCNNGGGGHYYYGGFGGFFPGAVASGGSINRSTSNNSTISRGGVGSGSDTSKATGSSGS